MANLQVLKSRIGSIEKTAAITNAMYQIASSKLVGAQNAFKQYYQFKDAFDKILKDVLDFDEANLFLNDLDRSENRLFILISADRGLVGGYHQQLFKKFLSHIEAMDRKHVFVITIGKRAYTFATKEKLNRINQNMIPNHDQVDESIISSYMTNIIQSYLENHYGQISVFSNKFVNSMTQTPENEVLLPLKIKSRKQKKAYDPYHYEDSRTETLNNLIILYVESRLYGLLIHAKLSEYASRITAMKSATDNANEALEKLKLKYNQARQQKITNELLDISNAKL